MKVLAVLGLALAPGAAAAWSAVHYDAVGAADGVLWAICLVTVVVLVCVAGAWFESRVEADS